MEEKSEIKKMKELSNLYFNHWKYSLATIGQIGFILEEECPENEKIKNIKEEIDSFLEYSQPMFEKLTEKLRNRKKRKEKK